MQTTTGTTALLALFALGHREGQALNLKYQGL